LIERFFPGVVQTRGSLQLAARAKADGEAERFAFAADGLRIWRDTMPGQDMRTVFTGLAGPARVEAARDLFQRALPLLDPLHDLGREHGAVHPGNILFGPDGLRLLDVELNRAALFHFGAGPIPAQPGQVDYRTWMFSPRRPRDIPGKTWDMAHLVFTCALLERGPGGWTAPLRAERMIAAVERWAESWSDAMPLGSDDAPRLKQAYRDALVVRGAL
jgi:hypothetical protein